MSMSVNGYVFCDSEREQISEQYVPFGLSDAKGRSVGCQVAIVMVTRTECDGGWIICKPEELGVNYMANIHVCRNEERFGGSSASKFFKTLDEAHQFANQAVERCRKANAKKFVTAASKGGA